MFKKFFRKRPIKGIIPTDDNTVLQAVLLEARRQRNAGLSENQLRPILNLEVKRQLKLMGRTN